MYSGGKLAPDRTGLGRISARQKGKIKAPGVAKGNDVDECSNSVAGIT